MTAATFLAACGATAAILCTLSLNAWHGWSQGNTLPQQIGMTAINVTIDLVKCGGLPAVSALWAARYRLRAVCLLPLWALAFAWSTFCGYSAILSTRSTATAQVAGLEQDRARAQRTYDEATATLATAKANPLWTASGGCTAIRPPHRAFCDGITRTRAERAKVEATLAGGTPVSANPEMAALAREIGQPLPWIIFMAALFPAVLLELVASVGFWAVGPRSSPKAPERPQEARGRFRLLSLGWNRKSPPAALLEASDEPDKPEAPAPATPAPTVTWKVAKAG